jgi:hypothetical protein
MPAPQTVNASEMRNALRDALSADPERSLVAYLRHRLHDPAALDAKGQERLHPVWLSIGILGAFALCVFVAFTLFGN